jgi:anti-sigma-K factor RskA
MYTALFHSHSGLRWIVLALAIVVVFRSLTGFFGGGQYKKLDRVLGSSFVGLMDLQLLLGVVLYFHSPLTKKFEFNMDDADQRFWSTEHVMLMIVAVAAAHIGSAIAKRSADDPIRFKFQSIFFTTSLVMMLLGIPWSRVF